MCFQSNRQTPQGLARFAFCCSGALPRRTLRRHDEFVREVNREPTQQTKPADSNQQTLNTSAGLPKMSVWHALRPQEQSITMKQQ